MNLYNILEEKLTKKETTKERLVSTVVNEITKAEHKS